MTPKEKAIELVEKFRNQIVSFLSDSMKDKNAKYCSLIACDEIIDAIDWHDYETPNKEFDFWQQVKTEIENL